MQYEWCWLPTQIIFLSLKVWKARIFGGTKAPVSHSTPQGCSWHTQHPPSPAHHHHCPSLPNSNSLQWYTVNQIRAQSKFKITNFYLFICFYNKSPSSTAIKGNLKWNCSLGSGCKEKNAEPHWKWRGTTGFLLVCCVPLTILKDCQSQLHSESDISKLYTE